MTTTRTNAHHMIINQTGFGKLNVLCTECLHRVDGLATHQAAERAKIAHQA